AGVEQLTLGALQDQPPITDKSSQPTSTGATDKPTSTPINEIISDAAPVADQPNLRPHSTFVLPSFSKSSNFLRNVQWCMDGSSLLGVTEHASVEILNLTGDGDGIDIKRAP
ncbi:hypothetical protein FRC11_005045, partial [Ceratobasidium sp. 423]